MTTTAKELEEVLYRGFDSVCNLALEYLNDIERAYLNAGKKGLVITGKLTISDAKEAGSYEFEPRISFTVEQVNAPGIKQLVNTRQQELPFGKKPEIEVCSCKEPWPVSIDGHSFICMNCLAEFPANEALEYFEAWAHWTLAPIDEPPGHEQPKAPKAKKKRKKKDPKAEAAPPAEDSQEGLATLF